eukprot:766763-Hanusia_phi.AAC.3
MESSCSTEQEDNAVLVSHYVCVEDLAEVQRVAGHEGGQGGCQRLEHLPLPLPVAPEHGAGISSREGNQHKNHRNFDCPPTISCTDRSLCWHVPYYLLTFSFRQLPFPDLISQSFSSVSMSIILLVTPLPPFRPLVLPYPVLS